MIFNAKVMSTMLYGVQIWGWEKFADFEWLQNEWQSLQVRTIKSALHLPVRTPDIPIYLESGMWPMMYYAIARTLTFAGDLHLANSKWLDHLISLNLPGGFNERIQSIIDRLPQEHTNEIDRLVAHFKDLLCVFAENPREETVQSRKLASYLAWVWNDELHTRPIFHKLDLSPSEYRLALLTRLMMIDVPMFSRANFHDRKCPLCHAQYGDIEHIVLECAHFSDVRQSALHTLHLTQPITMSKLFTSKNPTSHKFIAEVVALYKAATGR
jgi:hypothetical protein